jgi:hypothetical protein
MGLQEKLENEGSKFTYTADGAIATPYPNAFNAAPGLVSSNPLATQNSALHATLTGDAGYSLNGSQTSTVTSAWNQYKDGVVNPLPNPSGLDINGGFPLYGKYEDGDLAGAPGF